MAGETKSYRYYMRNVDGSLTPLGETKLSLTEGKTRGGMCPKNHEHAETKPHFHKNEQGELVKCFHECKSIVRQPSFWILTTLTFPIEHGIWSLIYNLFGWSH